jgi:hypothetical protein
MVACADAESFMSLLRITRARSRVKRRRNSIPQRLGQVQPRAPNFGPCHYCEYEPTTAASNHDGPIVSVCGLCAERLLALANLLRQPEHYVI